MKNLVLFQESHSFYTQFGKRPSSQGSSSLELADVDSDDPDDPATALGRAFATKSLILQNLAVAFLVTAEQVFEQCDPSWRWTSLQSLALTSPSLHFTEGTANQIDSLLYRAAKLVPKMPNLHTLVLWNGAKANACAFIFLKSIRDRKASITWRGNWHFSFTSRLIASWQRTVNALGLDILETKHELIEAYINSHGDAVHHLNLPCPVITPESLWQVRREAYTIDE